MTTEFTRGQAIVIADLHLHLYKGESKDRGLDRLQDGLRVLDQSLAAARRLKCVWLNLGDNKMPRGLWPIEVLSGMISVFKQYPEVPKLMVLGNHDGDTVRGSGLLPLADMASIVDRPTVFSSGFAMTEAGMPPFAVWPAGGNWAEYSDFCKMASDRKIQLLLGHVFVLGAFLGPNEVRLPGVGTPLTKLGVTPTGPFVLGLFGDVHKMQYWRPRPPRPAAWIPGLPSGALIAKDGWRGTALYPGSPYMQSWGEREDGTKGFLHLDFAKGLVQQIESDAPRFILRDYSALDEVGLEHARKSQNPLKDEFQGNFVRLRLPGFLSPTRQEAFVTTLLTGWKPRTLWVEAVKTPQSLTRVADLHAGLPMGDLLAAYIKARPLPPEAGISSSQLLTAGKRLLEDDA